MNYVQALFSIFNAPLFATFIIGMFWKRMTPWAGLAGLIAGTLGAGAGCLSAGGGGVARRSGRPARRGAGLAGLIAGTLGAAAVYLSDVWGIIGYGSELSRSFYGAMVAFVADAVVTVIVTLFTKPKPVHELQGLVYGMANEAEEAPASEKVWFRSPTILGAAVIGITFFLSLGFL